MKQLGLNIIILLVIIQYSCEKNSPGCFVSKGKIIKEQRPLTEFNNIRITDIFDLVLVQDSLNNIVLEGGKNLLPNVTTDIKNDTLIINNSTKCCWLRDYDKIKLYIHFTNIEHLVTYDPVSVISYDTVRSEHFEYYAIGEIGEADLILNCNYFRFDDSHNTLGHFKFRGKTDYSRFYINYGSSLYADSLISIKTDILYQTIGDIYVHVKEHLRVWIWGPGNVYYSGDPDLVETVEKRSTGTLIRAD